MKLKIVVGSVLIAGFIIFGAYSFMESNVKYVTIEEAKKTTRKVQIVGEWVKEKESYYDARTNQFIFYLKDDNGDVVKVVHNGAKPNNFEIASHVVVKGRYVDGIFESQEILTKCPSKYQSADALKQYQN
ncbi:cytochrome c-type biogenesis protein CcmE [Candidatus Kryptonium thompsonii]|jgi:cytochrome c-type biogenesis protein CcmE|uniref:Cytochrome c-type biogenesis protein CcmE n=1 Tax=Candidatus Kryptonium thompsonii TaxID=1633631 RepID=A0A0P1L7Q5_9BACT|nr:cytochrome c maturation protein CcmE [Candidatus Kryptonium thompsoni]CUS77026.1 cytochrome c-type biogenesis protein CcmE [Candidatus Kryptonium thompsoni]CUS79816.1 cytochrome c-type biogenesis protein CcmE [Candidatus Kryptonium thompsoni]CUS80297.1 cytochrome c-type biogenesis protein CcmE [Candidatus Kryptonium thompsoni]CUS81666.1 cytochrome c-type biogenesis protein CcmE [Candidatus Kryptonium thompsoni]CUS86294.1 cytochrome c-type biogenesis protein CcmE [Candidatus Kryptonium thomp